LVWFGLVVCFCLFCLFACLLVRLFLGICCLLFAFSLVALSFCVVCFLLLCCRVEFHGVIDVMWYGEVWFLLFLLVVVPFPTLLGLCARARACVRVRACVCVRVCACVCSFCLLVFFSFCCFRYFFFCFCCFLFAFCVFRSVPFYFFLWFVVAAVALSLPQSRAFASLFGFLFFLFMVWCVVVLCALWCVVF